MEPIIERRNSQAVMGLGEHLEELRARLIWALAGLLPILIVALIYGWTLVRWMLEPALAALRNEGFAEGLQITSALESFSAYFYVVVLATLIVGGPWVVFQLWRFVAPGLYAREKRFAYILAPLSGVLAVLGVLVMYFAMLPVALSFLFSFGTSEMRPESPRVVVPTGMTLPSVPVFDGDPERPADGQWWINREMRQIRVAVSKPPAPSPTPTGAIATPGPNPGTAAGAATAAQPASVEIFAIPLTKPSTINVHPKLDQYVDLFVNLTLVFALAFQLPVVMLLLGWTGLVTMQMLRKYRRHALAGTVILAAIITPTGDPISLFILQVPLYLLFEFGLLLMWLLPAHRVAGKHDEGDDDEPVPPTGGGGSGGGEGGGDPSAAGEAQSRAVPTSLGRPPLAGPKVDEPPPRSVEG